MRAVIIFAAGQGTRMKSALPKVLHALAHKPMLSYVVDTAHSLQPEQIIIVGSPELNETLQERGKIFQIPTETLTFTTQSPAKGTGHAMQVAFDALKPNIDDVVILYGDVPLVSKETLQPLFEGGHHSPCCFLGMDVTPPHAYGRMMTKDSHLERIVEDKDATASQKNINYVWSGVMRATKKFLGTYLPKLSKSPVTGEYYLTELVQLAHKDGVAIGHVAATNPEDFEGINDKKTLSMMERRIQENLREKFLEKGVKMTSPETVFFAHDTVVEEDATLMPYITFGSGVHIKKGATILSFCHIEDSVIESGASVGPFAHLRGGNHIGEKAVLGNFVEVKKTVMQAKAKAKHLTYLGDTEVGEGANIGAGTITCNYDGSHKYKTTIAPGAFIGSNVTLIAPVTIHESAYVGAGSVITEDVPAGTLALGRSRQVIKKNLTPKK